MVELPIVYRNPSSKPNLMCNILINHHLVHIRLVAP